MIFHENRLLADDSHEISYLIFSKIGEDVQILSSAAVVIAALRVNCACTVISLRPFMNRGGGGERGGGENGE